MLIVDLFNLNDVNCKVKLDVVSYWVWYFIRILIDVVCFVIDDSLFIKFDVG